ncbi:hypothetical protein BROUX41_005832 [Berkeleyomyces rouxiae]
MTAVAAPPAFSPLNNQQQQHQQQQTWAASAASSTGPAAPSPVKASPEAVPLASSSPPSSSTSASDQLRLFPRKSLHRSNSSSSISSTSSASSASSTTTVATTGSSPGTPASSTGEPVSLPVTAAFKKYPSPQSHDPPQTHRSPPKQVWLPPRNRTAAAVSAVSKQKQPNALSLAAVQDQASGLPPNLRQMAVSSAANGQVAQPVNSAPGPHSGTAAGATTPTEEDDSVKALLYLTSLNNTFERKTIHVPTHPNVLRIGRQTNQKTIPTPSNGYFDSKVLSRQHAEIWSDRSGKIWIRDVKSSNGTFVNNVRLSAENLDSDPHEIKTGDHLELGIDIIGEDGKTIIHHKVSAKVEHAGPASAMNNVMDFGFNDLDPSSSLLMSHSPSIQGRPRNGSNPGIGPNSRPIHGNGPGGPIGYPRPFMLTPVTTENIIKRLQNEIRGARLQNHDIERSETFINTLATKELLAPVEPATRPPLVNGYHSFRADSKTRFSDPPAPPPQQPLPEKPTDVPSWKKSPSDRFKNSPGSNHSSSRELSGQAFYMQTEIDNYKKKLSDQEVRLKVLEETLQSERSARQAAEDLNQKLEEAMASNHINGIDKGREESEAATSTNNDAKIEVEELQSANLALKALIESLKKEMESTSQTWERRLQKAEAEREIAQKSLAEMVLRLREESSARGRNKAQRHHHKSRGARSSSSSSASSASSASSSDDEAAPSSALKGTRNSTAGTTAAAQADDDSSSSSSDDETSDDEAHAVMRKQQSTTVSASKHQSSLKYHPSTATNAATATGNRQQQQNRGQALSKSLPYASVVGVVILGVGVMAFINGWQPHPRVEQ